MFASDFLSDLDALTQLDPVGTYAARGAAAVARLVHAGPFELVLDGQSVAAAKAVGSDGANGHDTTTQDGVMLLPLRLGPQSRLSLIHI